MPSIREYRIQAAAMRQDGVGLGQVARHFAARDKLTPRAAWRLANGLTQEDVAREWNSRWPSADGQAQLAPKQVSYWELWPGTTGREPSIAAVGRLAELYHCQLTDLVGDVVDSVVLPSAAPAPRDDTPEPEIPSTGPGLDVLPAARNVGVLSTYADDALRGAGAYVQRRDFLHLAATVPAALAVPAFADGAGAVRVTGDTLDQVEQVLRSCGRLEDVLGARAVLPTLLAQAELVEVMLATGPAPALRRRLVRLVGDVHCQLGWILFDVQDWERSRSHYQQAKYAAHEAGDAALAGLVLGNWSQLEVWAGRPHDAVDLAGSAQVWAARTGNPRAQVDAGRHLAHALSALGDHDQASRALEKGWAVWESAEAATGDPVDARFYFVDADVLHTGEQLAATARGDHVEAIAAADRSLAHVDAELFPRDVALTSLDRAELFAETGDLDGAAAALTTAVDMLVVNRSPRGVESLSSARRKVGRVGSSAALDDLDHRLAELRLV